MEHNITQIYSLLNLIKQSKHLINTGDLDCVLGNVSIYYFCTCVSSVKNVFLIKSKYLHQAINIHITYTHTHDTIR